MTTLKKQIILGGNVALFVIPATLIHSIASGVILYVGTNPTQELECASESIQHVCKLSETRAGTLYNHTVTAFVPGNAPGTLAALDLLHRYKSLVVVLRNAEGAYHYIGNTREGLRLTYVYNTDKDPSGRNGYEIEISGPLTASFLPAQMPALPL
jgi:hypothetical protein